MKAVDFIREFGWDEALAVVNLSRLVGIDKSIVDIDGLKQYVDAWELVQTGLQELKNQMFSKDKTLNDVEEWLLIVSESLLTQKGIDLKKAIQLVESVESGND